MSGQIKTFVGVLVVAAGLRAQSTQSAIVGRVTDAQTSAGIYGAVVTLQRLEACPKTENASTDTNCAARTAYRVDEKASTEKTSADAGGYYAFPLLAPGVYRIRVEATPWLAAEVQEQELRLAERVAIDFALRSEWGVRSMETEHLALTSADRIVRYFGPNMQGERLAPVDTAEAEKSSIHSSVSYSIDPDALAKLPLAGRDIYTLLAFLPAVTSDAGSARGLGLAIGGQRPSSSNYLLDGVEVNNTLLTGPAMAIPPEMMQEYRVSLNSWSAEYGRTNGFLANSVTRRGGSEWHGVGYVNVKHNVLNANSFNNNRLGLVRTPLSELQPGIQVGGPLKKNRLFVSLAHETFRSRSFAEAVQVTVPIAEKVPPSVAELFDGLPPPAPPHPTADDFATFSLQPRATPRRVLGLGRLDAVSEDGDHRLTIRSIDSRYNWPEFIWTPYEGLSSRLSQPASSHAGAYAGSLGGGWNHEARIAYGTSRTEWKRPDSSRPTLLHGNVWMPASPAMFAFRHSTSGLEWSDSWMRVSGPHILKFGGGMIHRRHEGFKTIGRDGAYSFSNLRQGPSSVLLGVLRTPLQGTDPNYERRFRESQGALFLEDSWRARPGLSLNAGVRYENFRPPVKVSGGEDLVILLPDGDQLAGRLVGARSQRFDPGKDLWSPRNANVAVRAGLAWSPSRSGPEWRAAYGLFFDRPFDNLWLTLADNAVAISTRSCRIMRCVAARPIQRSAITDTAWGPPTFARASFTLVDPKLQNGRSHNVFASVRQRLTPSFDVEVSGLGAAGKRLLTTDIVNRQPNVTGLTRYQPSLPDIRWRSNQGYSSYSALTILARYRKSRGNLHVAYTWSHSIDVQSDALSGEYADVTSSDAPTGRQHPLRASFLEQFKPEGDRGDSDYDQRHNLVFHSWWEIPSIRRRGFLASLTRDWRISNTAAIRSGFPYSVFGASTGNLRQQRANLLRADATIRNGAAGGAFLLDAGAFGEPKDGVPGNTGRNAFRGPGSWNTDVSVARTIAFETGRLILRADLFNVMNHANLGNPYNLITDKALFGLAEYAGNLRTKGLPANIPFRETPRQIQIIVKFEF